MKATTPSPLRSSPLRVAAIVSALAAAPAFGSTAYGDLNNFDCVNDTGEETHGFEIEIEGLRSSDVTYTYDWNHYGAPSIREDLADPAHPRVFIRYAAHANPDGTFSAYTAVPAAPLTPTDGHSCTNPSVNQGCEHFGVGYYGAPAAVKYHWLVADPVNPGQLAPGPAVAVSTPTWTYSPPVLVNPALPPDPPNIQQPAEVLAKIPAPEQEVPPGRVFGPPSWMKMIKTTTHNANRVDLGDLVSDDVDHDGEAEWRNNEPDEVEMEWRLVQNRAGGGDEVAALAPDEMGDGREVVTRRYEFYDYRDPNPVGSGSIDGENGEAMCDQVAADGVHGVGTVEVTGPDGEPYEFDCGSLAVVGDYVGAQMAAFAAAAPLGLIDHLQDGDAGTGYTPRAVVIGGNTPYAITVTGLPGGMAIGSFRDPQNGTVREGVLQGTPAAAGDYAVHVSVTDADGAVASTDYALHVAGDGVPLCSAGTLDFSLAKFAGSEQYRRARLTVVRSGATGPAVTARYDTSDGSAVAPADYAPASGGSLLLPAGSATATLTIPVVDDALDEAAETFSVGLYDASAGACLGAQAFADVSIADNDPPPTVGLVSGDQSLNESAQGSFTVTARLSAVRGLASTIPIAFAGSTATRSKDFTATTSIVIPAGQIEGSLLVPVLDDGLDETDEIVVAAIPATFRALGASGVTTNRFTIVDDDAPPSVGFATASAVVWEPVNGSGNATRSLAVRLSAPSGRTVTVPFARSAGADADATLVTASPLVFAPGQTARPIVLSITDDSVDEPNAAVAVTLGAPDQATLGVTARSVVTVKDNDP